MPYSEVSITGYNSNPPEDDGTEASSNEVSWAKHKTKLGDPLKTAIENTQTNITSAVSAIEADLIEAGTVMLFMQSSAPTGWTKDTTSTLNNTALRLVTGTVSSRTNQSSFSTVFGKTATDNHTLTTGQIPSHTHGAGTYDVDGHTHPISNAGSELSIASGGGTAADASSGNTGSSAPDVGGTSGSTGSGGSHGHGMDIRVNYHDVIKATKD